MSADAALPSALLAPLLPTVWLVHHYAFKVSVGLAHVTAWAMSARVRTPFRRHVKAESLSRLFNDTFADHARGRTGWFLFLASLSRACLELQSRRQLHRSLPAEARPLPGIPLPRGYRWVFRPGLYPVRNSLNWNLLQLAPSLIVFVFGFRLFSMLVPNTEIPLGVVLAVIIFTQVGSTIVADILNPKVDVATPFRFMVARTVLAAFGRGPYR